MNDKGTFVFNVATNFAVLKGESFKNNKYKLYIKK